MDINRIEDFVGGWIVGDFQPSKIRMKEAEFCVKYYDAGALEKWHIHKKATEITVIVSGCVRMNDQELSSGDVITIRPGEGTDFECLTDVSTAVFKSPSYVDDKYSE